jgi:uncharacterized protein Yka (UPF0111/DUF47 family)
MNTEKLVNEKISKIALKNHQIELFTDAEWKNMGQKAQGIYLDGKKRASQKTLEASSEMVKARKELNSLLKQIDRELAKVEKFAKEELDIDIRTTTVGKRILNVYKEVEEYVLDTYKQEDRIKNFRI